MATINFFNTKECEWSDTSVYVDGARLGKLRGVRYGVEKDLEAVHGEGDDPLFLNSGNRKYTGELKVLKGALDDINTAALAATGRDILDLELDIVVKFKAKGARTLGMRTLIGVQFSKFEEGWDQGSKQMEISMPMMFLRLI